MKNKVYLVIISLFLFACKSEETQLPDVLFSTDNEFVLVKDFLIEKNDSVEVWKLIINDTLLPVISITKEKGEYYLVDYIIAFYNHEIIKNKKINIDSLLQKYKLTRVGVEISKEINYKIDRKNIRNYYRNIKDSNQVKSEINRRFEIYDATISWIYKNDTINTYSISDVPSRNNNFNERAEKSFKNNRPLEDNFHYWSSYSFVFKNNNSYYFHSEFDVSHVSVEATEDLFKEIGSRIYINMFDLRYPIRKIKYLK